MVLRRRHYKNTGPGNTIEEFLSSDKGLDCIIEFQKENPDRQLFGENGMFQKIKI
jgi:hypothetical protein